MTAGWQEREPDDAELDALLDGRSVNLRLHARWQDVLARDPDYAAAERQYRAALREQRELYLIRLDGALRALREVARYDGGDAVRRAARADAEAVVRLVDERHLARVREARASFEAACAAGRAGRGRRAPGRRGGHLAGAASALVVAGGHVEVLLHVLRLFAVPAPAVVIAWSAGAMALTERVLLFHDRTPHSPSRRGVPRQRLGWLRGCVLLPHARRRLRTEDPVRMAELAARAAPARCVVLDDGVRLDLGSHGDVSRRTRGSSTGDGHIGEVA